MSDQFNIGSGEGLPPGATEALALKLLQAGDDPQFRDAFIADPKAAYQARFGEELLPGEKIEIRTTETGAKAVYLPDYQRGWVIPTEPGELSDEMLEMSGGKGQNPDKGHQS